MLEIFGYDLLGGDSKEGVRYAWKCDQYSNFLESAAFKNRSKGKRENICGYTTSVSVGCMLQVQRIQCSFCRTGNLLHFGRLLTYKEIAQQNIFMVLSDMECSESPELRTKEREFAYMGQGEPGMSYPQVRLAIELTNRVMEDLGQKVHRHIFATSGIPEAIIAYKNDVKNYFTQKVTLHLSVHSVRERNRLMPINRLYPIKECIDAANGIRELTGEKVSVGILLLNHFSTKNGITDFTNDVESLNAILDILNPNNFRLSFCEYNPIQGLCESDIYPQEMAEYAVMMARERGFEVKCFSSYGRNEMAACGMN